MPIYASIQNSSKSPLWYGRGLHYSTLIAARRYGRRFRRQITSATALRGTVCRWTVVRWSADAADFEDEPKKTPIGWSADERRILGFLLLSSSTFHFTLLNASVACGQNISLIFTDFCSVKRFFCAKKRGKNMWEKTRVDFFAIAVHNRHFLLQSLLGKK